MPRQFVIVFVATLSLVLGGFLSPAIGQIPSLGWFSGDDSPEPTEKPGTKQWWNKHKSEAEFVPGKGYVVPGYEGSFDKKGRPIDAPVDEVSVKLTVDTEKPEGLLPGLDPSRTAKRVREAVGLGPNEQEARQAIDEGVVRFQAEQFSQAADDFGRAVSRWPGSRIAALARFNQAESYYFGKQYSKAADTYIALLSEHPNTSRLDESIERIWAIAQFWEQSYFADSSHAPFDYNPYDGTRPMSDRLGHAIRLYEAIRLNDPTGPRADDAIMATAGINFRRERFREADYHYGLLRTEYPRSDHQFEAHLLGLQCKMRIYQGPDYDGKPLKEAKKLEERIRTNFGGRLSDAEQTRLRDVRAQLAAMIEERDLRMAEYYEGTEHFGSAALYYQKLIDEHPDSPAGQLARQKLSEIGSKPAIPATRMEWFVDWFPTNQNRSEMDNIIELAPDAGRTMVAENPESETIQR